VRFGAPRAGEWLGIGEGLETTLSVAVACALPVWAALSAGGIERLVLQPEARMILICADNDANSVGVRAARAAAERFLAEGRRVRLATPPTVGSDFNDVLLGLAASWSEEVRNVAN
jgi:putative DNA primase/helicase